jgi:hypothetical protein
MTADADEAKRIKSVILWQNGMVMVFDDDGQQMPELQGPKEEAMRKLRAAGWTGTPERRVWTR